MIRLRLVALACATLSIGAAALAHATPEPEVVTLRNGMRVLLAPDSAAMAVDVAVWYPAGTRWEPANLAGVSHLVTRLMFRGSKGVPDGAHRRQLQEEGGVVNTTNTPDGTCYWETIPAEALPLALRLEADRMASLAPSAAAFAQSRADARTDRRLRAEPSPIARGLARLLSTAFGDDAYGRSPYGEDAALRRMTLAEVEAWRRAHDAPAGALLTIVGRFEPRGTLAYVRALFESLPAGTAPAAPKPPAPQGGARHGWDRGATPVRLLFAGWRGPGASDADAAALSVIAALLGAQGSEFENAMTTDWKSAVLTEAGLQSYRDASLLWVVAALRPEADSSSTERVLVDQVERLARDPIDQAEFERVRSRLALDALFGAQPVRARAALLGQAVFEDGHPARATDRAAALERLTTADLQRVAQRWLVESGRSVAWFVPAGEGR